ncbi:hypothetical protein [Haloplanus natans]|nr:hypothetical protein [Haloplanus natans]
MSDPFPEFLDCPECGTKASRMNEVIDRDTGEVLEAKYICSCGFEEVKSK